MISRGATILRAIALVAGGLGASFAMASPIVSIGDGQSTSWTQGMSDTNVEPFPGMTGNGSSFYGAQAAGGGFGGGANPVIPTLTPDVPTSDGSTTKDGLVNSYDPEGTNTLEVSGWDYDYNGDPDLTNLFIDVELFAPHPIDSLGIEIIDINGNAKSWFRANPTHVWDNSYVFNASGNLQAPFTHFFQDPAFDLTTVERLRFTMAAPWNATFPPDPTGIGQQWHAWAHLRIVPEPATMLILGLGACSVLLRRRRRA